MHYEYKYIIYIIIVEFSLVILVVLLTLILKSFDYIATRNNSIAKNQIETYLNQFIASEKKFQIHQFPRKWRKINLLLPIVAELNKLPIDSFWHELKVEFIQSIVLPLARKAAHHKNWLRRFFAAEAFGLMSSKDDEKTIIDLINDELPIVYLNAVVAAVNYGSPGTINAVISRMAKERRFLQNIYKQSFDNSSSQIQNIVKMRLQKDNDPYARAACYKILSKCPSISGLPSTIEEDIQSTILDLKLSVIRFLVHAQQDKAIPVLIKQLSSDSWEVRVVALRGLSDLGGTQALSEITHCLQDKVWWVRLAAAQTLKQLGNEGIEILKTLDPKVDRFAFEAAQYVLGY